MRRAFVFLASTFRYTDGTGRQLDSGHIPTELFLEPISNKSYPIRGSHWQPVVVATGDKTPFKGHVLVTGGGVVGSVAALMFSLRGWYVTVVDKRPAPEQFDFCEHVLLTKRAVDALGVAGIRKGALASIGVPVVGVMNHSGSLSTILTRGLVEKSKFALKNLSVDLNKLREIVCKTMEQIPGQNAKLFYDHELVALMLAQKKAIVRPLRMTNEDDRTAAAAKEANTEETQLSTAEAKWEEYVEGIDYDVFIGADGVFSSSRRLMQVSGMAQYDEFGKRWYRVTGSKLAGDHIHRWAHKPIERCYNCPTAIAYPTQMQGVFSVMVYAPHKELDELSAEEIRKKYFPALTGEIHSPQVRSTPSPTIFCYSLHNYEDKAPSAVLVGDAAHSRHPFLMQDLPMALEDVATLLNCVDGSQGKVPKGIHHFSQQRGPCGDSLRHVTERSLYYEVMRHRSPLIRIRNSYYKFMHYVLPRSLNQWRSSSNNQLFARGLEWMMNGRGYSTYEYIDKAQYKTSPWFCFGKIYT